MQCGVSAGCVTAACCWHPFTGPLSSAVTAHNTPVAASPPLTGGPLTGMQGVRLLFCHTCASFTDCCFVTPVAASQIVLSHLWQHHRLLFCHTCGSITTVDSWSPSQVSKVSDCCLIYDAFRVFPGQISGKN